MKITVRDVTNNEVNVRKYLRYNEETGRIYVAWEHLDTVLIDKMEEWERLKKRVQDLEKDVKELEIVNECWEEINENLAEQNKRYREAIEFGIEYLKNSDIRQVQLVVTLLKSALEDKDE